MWIRIRHTSILIHFIKYIISLPWSIYFDFSFCSITFKLWGGGDIIFDEERRKTIKAKDWKGEKGEIFTLLGWKQKTSSTLKFPVSPQQYFVWILIRYKIILIYLIIHYYFFKREKSLYNRYIIPCPSCNVLSLRQNAHSPLDKKKWKNNITDRFVFHFIVTTFIISCCFIYMLYMLTFILSILSSTYIPSCTSIADPDLDPKCWFKGPRTTLLRSHFVGDKYCKGIKNMIF